MDPKDFRQIIQEAVAREKLNEALTNLDQLQDGVSSSTEVGKAWFQFITNLERLIDETKDFKAMYPAGIHGPSPNTQEAMRQLAEIVQACQKLKPYMLGMDQIQARDV